MNPVTDQEPRKDNADAATVTTALNARATAAAAMLIATAATATTAASLGPFLNKTVNHLASYIFPTALISLHC